MITSQDPRSHHTPWSWSQILSYLQLFLEAGSKLVRFCTKFKLTLVLLLLRSVLVCEYWYCAANQYSKVIGFVKNFKEGYDLLWFSINSLHTTSKNLLFHDTSRNKSMNVQNWSSGGVLKKSCNLSKTCRYFLRFWHGFPPQQPKRN